MTDQHTTKAFDADLQDIRRTVAEMGGLAERQVADSFNALIKRDVVVAQRIIAAGVDIDTLHLGIEEKAVNTIARRQPMAVDLREIVGAMRVTSDLKYISNLAKSVARRVIALHGEHPRGKRIRGVKHMTDLVLEQIKNVLDSYARHDLNKAMAVWRGDEEIDELCTSVLRELLTYMLEDPRNIAFCTHVMFCAKDIERMGDHATNIAETVHYVVEGQSITDPRPKSDTTAFATSSIATDR